MGRKVGAPNIDEKEILFNGVGDDGHESFELLQGGVPVQPYETDRDYGFQFCKTARKSYDSLVCACLLVYKHHSPDTMELSSDGDSDNWEYAESFLNKVLGYDDTFAQHNKYNNDEE